ncbi:hypothetical protein AQPE_2224 [Aquipluma nitroreducens]|uniref:Uncharacterized protein n=1 Tax=Aquipluma nitroreducens TaxID=2010828 RepID=A0A5K7S9U1_9BACT|nr:hypothetical protein [Aquipluma nitroreducens]BBE18064.1 hypothetical protein AQPE_2224 [Aquipluma nitroreducens]
MTLSILNLYGQEDRPIAEGKVSYITLQNIYVKFETSGLVQPGDTVFIRKDQALVPLFVTESVSSLSCVGKPVAKTDIKVSDVVVIKVKKSSKPTPRKDKIPTGPSSLRTDSVQSPESKLPDKSVPGLERAERIWGRLSATSYSSFSNTSDFNQRMRYTFTLSADHISGGRISTDTYITFTHKLNEWATVKNNIFDAFKIYSLSVNYDVTNKTQVAVGRKINPKIASIGAIDGLQAETKAGNFTLGAVAGTSPDYTDYSFNPKLFEYGGYISHDINNKSGNMSSSLAFFQQTSHGMTDRRFAYFQHDNSLIKNINLFVSSEVDLYALKDSIPTNTISLTSLYLSLRYRVSKQLSAYLSYDARKNVIYYETFKNYLDLLLQDATRQGYQLRINYRPSNSISSSLTGGYRFQKNDIHPMLNVNGFLTFSKVPGINSSVTFSTNWIQSSYVDGMIYGVQLDKELVPSKLSAGINYRLVDNKYLNATSGPRSLQHMAALELSWQISKKMYFSANYDGTFEKSNKYHSIYVSLTQRF